MNMPDRNALLRFESQRLEAVIRDANGEAISREIEVRTHPISGRKCRIAFSRSEELEPGTEHLPPAPPDAEGSSECPFCPGNITHLTPRLRKELDREGRMVHGTSTLIPNLFPYGAYSAVSLFDDRHFVEIGTAHPETYADCLSNCARYLEKVLRFDPRAQFMAITQNHLPAAGGSLVHPHLQVHADRLPSNQHAFLMGRADQYHRSTGRLLFSDYLAAEQMDGRRIIGETGPWHWLAAFAPEGFFEIWALYPGKTAFSQISTKEWKSLSRGVVNAQRFYRSLFRNSYNLGVLSVESDESALELQVVLIVRANYAPWVRNDITGYEVMLGDMATFTAPEETARQARAFWQTG
ncbi:MAG: galactose-1-phosphate uridylyltransferase [Desulfobacteraceae bacterium]